MLISLCINCDTRPARESQAGMFSGVVSRDFLTEGVYNKKKFFDGFDIETILFLDLHQDIDETTLEYLRKEVDTLVIRKHTDEAKFNDTNYWCALALCRGDIVVHIDQDASCFTPSPEPVHWLIKLLDTYDYVSYPSPFSPNPDVNHNYDYYWCSTRFFMCKRETLDFTEIKKCLFDSEYLYGKYPASVRNPWTEHILALISKYTGKGVYYPPIEYGRYLIFCWENYEQWTLNRLNNMSYEEVKNWVINKGGINYPNHVVI